MSLYIVFLFIHFNFEELTETTFVNLKNSRFVFKVLSKKTLTNY